MESFLVVPLKIKNEDIFETLFNNIAPPTPPETKKMQRYKRIFY